MGQVANSGALKLYQALGFIRDKRLHRCGKSVTGKNNRGALAKEQQDKAEATSSS